MYSLLRNTYGKGPDTVLTVPMHCNTKNCNNSRIKSNTQRLFNSSKLNIDCGGVNCSKLEPSGSTCQEIYIFPTGADGYYADKCVLPAYDGKCPDGFVYSNDQLDSCIYNN